ncbi:hypothetical protein DP116_00865 [Brasilonema bromeliae SPC951]|uniref:Uncharacterized protein n=1 Tax=Brasilonema bromeliae SPC951 TaxID=385972 RepID=A0ABX1P336_9CYAN|nr:hypothetical protein [Brasilonema bromeliae SPC951]
MVGWVKRSATQQQTFCVGFPGVKRQTPTEEPVRSWGLPKWSIWRWKPFCMASAPQPTQFKGFGSN